jgi:hypothetical protein
LLLEHSGEPRVRERDDGTWDGVAGKCVGGHCAMPK